MYVLNVRTRGGHVLKYSVFTILCPDDIRQKVDQNMTPHLNLQEWFGQIDIYLFDQLLKGRFDPRMRVLDAGCGGGRNLVYFLREGYDVCAVDRSAEAVARVRALALALAPRLPADNFRVEPVEGMTFDEASFDL